ncbi:MAG: alpha/beta hydrolase [Burkholderiaceae bacterium]
MLDPQAKALLELVASLGRPPMNEMTAEEARLDYLQRRFFSQPEPPAMASVKDFTVPGRDGEIPVRSYRPAGSADDTMLPVLVYLHGGGWTIGDCDTHDVLCRELANGAGCAVVSVDYRMGPEHRFPAAVHDCIDATAWVAANAESLNVDPARIAIGGDSAGGNLSAVVALAARDAGGPALAFQLLIYPATDMRLAMASHGRNGSGYLLTSDLIGWFRGNYVGPEQYDDWRASPLLAESFVNLPPALVLTAGYDPLVDEGKAYADVLAAAGVPVEYVCYEGQIHGFITMGKVLDQANHAVARCAAALKAVFAAA